MAVDVMRRLSSFRPLDEYRYIGLGGYEFIDFDLVHRALGVNVMTSIEDAKSDKRFIFNRPFADITIELGTTNDRLQDVAIGEPSIVWMDYCAPVRQDVLQDVLLLGQRMAAGNLLLITVNAKPKEEEDERLADLEARVGDERIPMGVTDDKDLDGAGMANAQRQILAGELDAALRKRNDSTEFRQLFDIQYRDTTRMQTWGGLFIDPDREPAFQAADFKSLSQVRTEGEEALVINVPILTAREVLKLEYEMEHGKSPPELDWLKASEERSFADLHRWYPRVPAPM